MCLYVFMSVEGKVPPGVSCHVCMWRSKDNFLESVLGIHIIKVGCLLLFLFLHSRLVGGFFCLWPANSQQEFWDYRYALLHPAFSGGSKD